MKNDLAASLWARAGDAFDSAEKLLEASPDNSASRSYYAAFHAVSALFALDGRTFRSHKEIWAAFHRELIHTGRWEAKFSDLIQRLTEDRETADYGGIESVSPGEARKAHEAAREILEAVHRDHPGEFPLKIEK